MAETEAAAGLVPQHWSDKFFTEYVRANRWRRYMGTAETSMIQVREDLTTKAGDKITFATVRRLKQAGVRGDTMLEGREEEIDSRSMGLTVEPLRHAVLVTKWQGQRSVINLANAGRSELRKWAKERMKDDLIDSCMSIDGVLYADATAGQRNTWMQNNADRVLFGAAIGNAVSGVMATALLTIDASADKLSPAIIELAKRRAQLSDPPISPIVATGEDGEMEQFILFVPALAMRDLRNNADMKAALKDAMERGKGNPLFTSGDLIWDNVIIKEDTNIPVLAGVGAGGIDVAPCFLMGAQALGIAWAMRTQTVVEERDYKWRAGIAIQEIRGIGKLRFGTGSESDTSIPKQAGMLNLFVSAEPDA